MALISDQCLLTIAIPTFNRSEFLDIALHYIFLQTYDKNYSIEIIVCDNCSTDNTSDIINKYIEIGMPIEYLRNSENKGADYNVAQCFTRARGKYILAFGDDDILLEGAIENIMSILSKHPDFGILYLSFCSNSIDVKSIQNDVQLLKFHDYEEFLKKVTHNITFISGNIVNSKYVNGIFFEKYLGLCLIQLPLFLTAVFNSPYNLMLTRPAVAVPLDNSGGYSICTVFGKNINLIFNEFYTDNKKRRVFRAINKDLLLGCFPEWIRRLKSNQHKFLDKNLYSSLFPVFKYYFSFWALIFILIIQPKKLFNLTWPFFKLYWSLLGFLTSKMKSGKPNYLRIDI